jgi:putative phosphoribosyl transferase
MFETINRKFQLKFKDRAAAGIVLGEILKGELKEKNGSVVVLGVLRGGVITAGSVIEKLATSQSSLSSSSGNNLYFDIIIPRKLTDPDNKEHAIGGVMEDGTCYIDQELISMLQISQAYLEKEKAYQIAEIKRRTTLYSANAPAYNSYLKEHLRDKTVLLVDDGAATGATLIAAARWLRRKQAPKRLTIAVPVASKDAVKRLTQEADSVQVVTAPSSNFRSVEQFYHDFQQVPDDGLIEFLRNRNMCICN